MAESKGYSLVAVRRLLIAVASGMWDLPGSGIKPICFLHWQADSQLSHQGTPGAPLSQRLHSVPGGPTSGLELACVLPSPISKTGNGGSERFRDAKGHSASQSPDPLLLDTEGADRRELVSEFAVHYSALPPCITGVNAWLPLFSVPRQAGRKDDPRLKKFRRC